jgi:hypothetical protein
MTCEAKYKPGQHLVLCDRRHVDEQVQVLDVEWRELHRSIGLGNDAGQIAFSRSRVPGEFVYKVRRQGGETEGEVEERDLRLFSPADR